MKYLVKVIALNILIFIFSNCLLQAQWVQTNGPAGGNVYSLAVSGNNIFAGTRSGGVSLSTDDGNAWTQVNNGLSGTWVIDLNVLGTNIFALVVDTAGTSISIYRSTNNGTNWTWIGNDIHPLINTLAVSGNNIFAGTNSGVYLSLNNGDSWSRLGQFSESVGSMAVNGITIFAATYTNSTSKLYLTTDGGTNWKSVNNGLPDISIKSLIVNGNNIFAGFGSYASNSGVYLSTNFGTSWTQIINGLTSYSISSLISDGNNIFAGNNGGGLYVSTNNGTSWVPSGLAENNVSSLSFKGTNIFAGTYQAGVWKRSLSELVGITKEINILPHDFMLSQNYPNPFNPSTTIKYSLPKASLVSIKVYSILGNEIETLANEEKQAGSYEVTFNAASLPSGIYFYRVQAGSFVVTKKIVLLK